MARPGLEPGSGGDGDRYLLALDAGIGGGRCLIFTPEGRLVGRGYEEWSAEPVPGVDGALAFDPERYWGALAAASRAALAAGGVRAERVGAISVTCQREGFVLLDGADRVVYAGPSADVRGGEFNARLAAEHGAALYPVTGHLPDAFHLPGRLLWLQARQPEAFARGRRVMMINDWMLHRLSGVWVGEASNASSSALFDIREGDWSDWAIALAGLPREIFPPIVPSGTPVGELSARAAAETGLAAGTPVVVGGGDGQCGMLGAGAVERGDVAAIAGTTTPILMRLDRPLFDPGRRTWARAGLRRGEWAVEANAGITGLAFRWLRDLLYEAPSEHAYEAMVQLAAGVPIGANGTRSFLGPRRMATRWWTGLTAGGRLTGIGPFGGQRAEIVRATMESVCYAVRANCELLEEVSGGRIAALRLVGGQSRSAAWTQMQADVLGLPVLVPSVSEASGWGAALCAGLGAGYWPSLAEAARASITEQSVEPRVDHQARYDDLYRGWLDDVSPPRDRRGEAA